MVPRPSNPNLPDSILPHQLDVGATEDVTRAPHFHEAKVKVHRYFGCGQLESEFPIYITFDAVSPHL